MSDPHFSVRDLQPNFARLGKLLGKEVRLKFHMTQAQLHAMTTSDAERPLGPVEAEYRIEPSKDFAPTQN